MEFALGFDFADVTVVENGRLRVRGSRGVTPLLLETPLSGRGVKAKAANTRKTLRISDTRKEPAYLDDKGPDWAGPPTMLSELAVPVVVEGETVAVLNVESARSDTFTAADQELLEILAFHVGSAFKRLKYEQHLEQLVAERTKELSSAKERLDYVIQSNPAVIYLAKPFPDLSDYYATFQSKNTVSITGFESEEYIGEKGAAFWASRVHPDDLASYRAGTAEFWKRGHRVCEYRFLHKNGTYRWIMEESNVICDGTGAVRDIIGYWTDVTERKRMEEELRSTRDRLGLVLASNPAVLFLEKPLPNLSNTFSTFVSESATSVLGFESESFLGESGANFWRSRVHPDDLTRYLAEMPSLWRDGHHTFEFRFLHSDGEYRWIREEMKVTRDAEGRVLDVVGVGIDLTERKKLEEKLANAERLAAIGETAAMVGHDLRNPLQGMTGAVYLAKNLSKSESVEDKKEVVALMDTLDHQIQYMDKIVSDLQNYAGPIRAAPVETNLPGLIKETLTSANIPENVETTVTVAQGDLSKVMLDSKLVKRILFNLIVNAVQAMPNGGKLVIEPSKKDDSLTLSVRDTGVGIPQENMGKLFDPFFTTKAKGQGLGLPVCKRLLEAQNGSITVKSEVGKGSTFIFTIPANRSGNVS